MNAQGRDRVISVFGNAAAYVAALKRLQEAGLRDLATTSPTGMAGAWRLLPRSGSPVRFVTLVAALAGAALGFWMCIGSALLYGLIVGGKWPASWLPYCVIGFELTILVGGLATVAAVFALARLSPRAPRGDYDPRVQVDKFGLTVYCEAEQMAAVDRLLREAGAEEVQARRAADDG